jgi:hypothetical protein
MDMVAIFVASNELDWLVERSAKEVLKNGEGS